MTNARLIVVGLLLCAAAPIASPALAQTQWIDPNGGAYNDAGNWSPANVPNTNTETPSFNLSAKFTVTLPGASAFTIDDLLVSDGTVIFAVAGGVNADATLNLTDDLIISNGAELALLRDGTNYDVNLNIPSTLQISGGGQLTLQDGTQVHTEFLNLHSTGGGTITLADSATDLYIDTLGSTNIGLSGNVGTLNITQGADLNMAGELQTASSGVAGSGARINVHTDGDAYLQSITLGVGSAANQSSVIDIDGAGSQVVQAGASTLQIGNSGNALTSTARVRVDNSGAFTTGTGGTTIAGVGQLEIGANGSFNANANITATGPNAAVTVESGGNLNLGSNILRLESGAKLNLPGVLNLTGGSEVIEVVDDSVVDATTGGLNLQNGARINTFSVDSVVNTGAAPSMLVNGSAIGVAGGGTVNLQGDMTIDNAAIEFAGGSGTLNFSPNTDILVTNGGQLGVPGTIAMQENMTFSLDGSTSAVNFGGFFNGVNFGNATSYAEFTLSNGADLNATTLSMGGVLYSGAADTVLNVGPGSNMHVANTISLGSGSGTGTNTLNIEGVFQGDGISSTIRIGSDQQTGTQVIANIDDGLFIGVGRDIEVNATGQVNLSNFGQLYAEQADIIVRGGTIVADPATGGVIGVGFGHEGRSILISDGGQVIMHGNGYAIQGSNLTVSGPGSTFQFMRRTGDTEPSYFHNIGYNGTPDAMLAFSQQATGVFEDFNLGADTWFDGHVQLDVETGAVVTVDNLAVGTIYFRPSDEWTFYGDADLNIDGIGSRVETRPGFDAYIGSNWIDSETSGYMGEVTLTDGGTLDVSGGTINIGRNGQINVHGGTLLAGAITKILPLQQIDFQSGSIELGSPLTVDNAEPLGPSLDLGANKSLTVGGALTINAGRMVTLSGGSLTVESFAGDGEFNYHTGDLTVTGAGGLAVGPTGPLAVSFLSLGNGQAIQVPGGQAVLEAGLTLAVESGGQLTANSVQNNGTLILDGLLASVRADGVLTNNGLMRGTGTVHASLTNAIGGEVRVSAGEALTINDAAHANNGQLTLLGGELAFGGILANNSDGNIFGRGTLIADELRNFGDIALSNGVTDVFGDTTNYPTGRVIVSGNADVSFWDDFENQGAAASVRVSAGSSATFFGTYAGAGTSGSGDVFFEADVTPGFSPGLASFGGNVTFSPLARLVSELASGTPGSEYDQLDVAGVVELAGELKLELLGGYSPALGDLFTLIRAGSVGGRFDQLTGTALGLVDGHPAGLAVVYEATEVYARVSLLGDANLDDVVDVVDLGILATHWQGAGDWLNADFNADGVIDVADLGAVATNWQVGAGGSAAVSFADAWAAAQADVPEPSTLALLLGGAAAGLRRGRGGRGH